METIRIACDGASTSQISELIPFQGELKSLSTEDYGRLKQKILQNGFTAPIHVWKNENKLFLLDGHQRVRTLEGMRNEGYEIPPIPIDFIYAETYHRAKDILLAHASQYGKFERQGLYEFVMDANIDITKLMSEFRIPEVDLPSFNAEFFMDGITGSDATGSKELGIENFSDFNHKCPRCGFEFDGQNNGS
jgi:hypothetical protein